MRNRHPLQGQLLAVLGWTHRHGTLHLTVVLPDGTRSLIPAAWMDLQMHKDQKLPRKSKEQSKPSGLGSVLNLLHACKIVDALLLRLDSSEPTETTVSTEESKSEMATELLAPNAKIASGVAELGSVRSRAAKRSDSGPGSIDKQGSPSRKS